MKKLQRFKPVIKIDRACLMESDNGYWCYSLDVEKLEQELIAQQLLMAEALNSGNEVSIELDKYKKAIVEICEVFKIIRLYKLLKKSQFVKIDLDYLIKTLESI